MQRLAGTAGSDGGGRGELPAGTRGSAGGAPGGPVSGAGVAALLLVLLAWVGPPLAAQGLLQAELPADYWMAARWQQAASGEPDDVVIDWGISRDDLRGWGDDTLLPYRVGNETDDRRIWFVRQDGEKLALWDIETYRRNGLQWYAALWRKTEQRSLLADGFDDPSELLAARVPTDYHLVDFECYSDNGHRKYLGLWRNSGSTGRLEFARLSFENLQARLAGDGLPPGEIPARVVDLEQCLEDGAGLDSSDLESAERFLVLLELGAGSASVEVGRGPWEGKIGDDSTCEHPEGETPLVGLHPCYHSKEVHVVELESVPVGVGEENTVSKWEYVWVWEPVTETGLGWYCPETENRPATDWLMVTNAWYWLEREVRCRNTRQHGSGPLPDVSSGECGRKCHSALQLVDLILGTERLEEAGYDDPQHRPTHGDGAGGPKL